MRQAPVAERGVRGAGERHEAPRARPAGAGEPVEVAIKELGAGASAREEQAFVKEFRLSFEASQRCPGACRMYGCVHRADGAFCLVMKRYQGSLAHMLEERRDPSDDSRRAPMAVEQASVMFGRA